MDFKTALVDSSRLIADMVADVVGNNKEYFEQILNIVFEDDQVYAPRAARVLELVSSKYPSLIFPHINMLAKKLPDFKENGVKRNITKTISQHQLPSDEDSLGILTDTCFRWLRSESVPVAIKIYSMHILQRVVKQIPELTAELLFSIEEQMPHASPGFKARGKIILKYFNRKQV